jgi:hypothetical protein
MLYARQGCSEIGIQGAIDEIRAPLTITIPIVSNWQTDGDSSLPNAWWNSTVLRIFLFTKRSLYQRVPEKL